MADEKNVDVVFAETVKERLAAKPNQWPGEASAAVTRAIVESRHDSKGKPIELTPLEEDVILLASRSTNEIQVRVIKRIIETHGGKFDADTERRVKQVVTAAVFKTELVKAGLIKEDGDSDLKDLLS